MMTASPSAREASTPMTGAGSRAADCARRATRARTPLFGSCWGLHVIAVATGGSGTENPKGREIGFGRRIRLHQAGRGHAMYAGKDEVFNAASPCISMGSRDAVPPGMAVMAGNAMSEVQAAEIRSDGAQRGHARCNITRTICCMTSRRNDPPHQRAACCTPCFWERAEPAPAHARSSTRSPTTLSLRRWPGGQCSTSLILNTRRSGVKEITNPINHQVLPCAGSTRHGLRIFLSPGAR